MQQGQFKNRNSNENFNHLEATKPHSSTSASGIISERYSLIPATDSDTVLASPASNSERLQRCEGLATIPLKPVGIRWKA